MALYAFDGTWNQEKSGDDAGYQNTNVVRFYGAYHANSGTGDFYVAGVGTRLGAIGKAFGGAFGMGEVPRLHEAYRQLCRNWIAGDRDIDIIGFSRGAATTLDFCHNLLDHGIQDPTGKVVEKHPQIRFLGVWDVVPAFGLGNLGLDLNIGHHLHLPRSALKFCFHALALDERRPSFVVTRLPGACEVWFRGVHSDIGGGNGNQGLNDITLAWMMRKAKCAGLPITDADVARLKPDGACAPHLRAELVLPVRHISAVDRKHYTVSHFPGATDPPDTCPVETAEDEAKVSEIGANGLELLPPTVRAQINALVTQAQETAAQQGWELGPAGPDLLMLIQNRIALLRSEADLVRARQSTANLVATMIDEARDKGFAILNSFFLTAALYRFSNLFPYTD